MTNKDPLMNLYHQTNFPFNRIRIRVEWEIYSLDFVFYSITRRVAELLITPTN